jgi:DNA replication protein
MSNVSMDALDFRYLLLDNYKKLGLSEVELSVIMMIDHLVRQKNTLVTPDLLAIKMNLKTEELDKILVKLLNKNFLEFDTTGKKTKTTLEPLRIKLYELFQASLAYEQETKVSKEKEASLQNIYSVFEKELGRTLSPVEFSLISEWVNSYGYSDELIINALKDTLNRGKKSLRSVDKTLLQWQTRDDIEKEGVSAVNEKWTKDIEKTIKIAQTKWIDNTDENKK